jgi:uncharacterized membrane protein YfcA
LYAVAAYLETSYSIERYQDALKRLSPAVFLWSLCSTLFALQVGAKLASFGGHRGLAASVAVLVSSAALQFVAVCSVLPDAPVTRASFQTYTARAAYLKDSIYFIFLGIFLICLPIDFVRRLRAQVSAGHASSILRLLSGSRAAIIPTGSIYPRFSVLAVALIATAVVSIPAGAHLLDNLRPSPHMGLFMTLFQIERLLYFLTALGALSHYYLELNAVKKLCLQATTVSPS